MCFIHMTYDMCVIHSKCFNVSFMMYCCVTFVWVGVSFNMIGVILCIKWYEFGSGSIGDMDKDSDGD